MTADVVDMRAEAKAIAARRTDVIRQPSSTCSPFAALLHRVASVITTEDLPPAKVTVTPKAEVLVDLTGSELVESDVRRWSAALGLIVSESAVEVRGFAARRFIASGFDGHGLGSGSAVGAWWCVSADELLPSPVRDRFGCGIGPAT